MPGHRPAGAGHVETHCQLAAPQFIAFSYEGKYQRIAPHRFTGCNGYAVLAAKSDRAIGAWHHRRARPLQTNECAIECDRLSAERIGKSHSRFGAPELGL